MVLEAVNYVPTLAVRASEMNGLQYLPQATKERMHPCFLLAPWYNSSTLGKTVERARKAYGGGSFFLDIDLDYISTNGEQPAQAELLQVKDPTNSFENWRSFIAEHPGILPCLQLRDQDEAQLREQIEGIRKLGRSFALRIFRERPAGNVSEVVSALNATGSADFAVILEGGWARDALQLPLWYEGLISGELSALEAQVPIVASCTTIPKEFGDVVGTKRVSFSNRTLLNQVARSTNERTVIYGDWGSTRPRQRQGGGGPIPPRIDYPVEDAWHFYRNTDENWSYRDAAKKLIEDEKVWQTGTGQWGEQMLSETAQNEAFGVDTPQKNVAVRVNLHLHRQAFYGQDLPDASALDEDWNDNDF